MSPPLVVRTAAGLYCPPGGFYIDPMAAVRCALTTHAHADHARSGSVEYRCSAPGAGVLRRRIDPAGRARILGTAYREVFDVNGVGCSWHPAGHVLGSAQLRLEFGGEVWVVTGDFKRIADPTCAPFESVACDVLITESTFGLPVYRFEPGAVIARDIRDWWRACAAAGATAVVWAYSLGKTQRLLGELGALGDLPGPLVVHPAADGLCGDYVAEGIDLPPWMVLDVDAGQKGARAAPTGALVVAPPGGNADLWLATLGTVQAAVVSGWSRVRKHRGRSAARTHFALSDHADWPDLVRTALESKARRVCVHHGPSMILAEHLRSLGVDAGPVPTGIADPASRKATS